MKISVYYLDDEEKICEIFAEFFNSERVQVSTFIDANEAIEASNKNAPDLFFIDYQLSGMTGDEVAFAVEPSIPKMLVTGDLTSQCKYNFEKVIAKPYKFSEIQKIIDSYCTSKPSLAGGGFR